MYIEYLYLFQKTVFSDDNKLNPYTTCLSLMKKSPDYGIAKMQGLAGQILKEFCKFLSLLDDSKRSTVESQLSQDIQVCGVCTMLYVKW